MTQPASDNKPRSNWGDDPESPRSTWSLTETEMELSNECNAHEHQTFCKGRRRRNGDRVRHDRGADRGGHRGSRGYGRHQPERGVYHDRDLPVRPVGGELLVVVAEPRGRRRARLRAPIFDPMQTTDRPAQETTANETPAPACKILLRRRIGGYLDRIRNDWRPDRGRHRPCREQRGSKPEYS